MPGFANDSSGNSIMWSDNVDFSGNVIPSRAITTNGQLSIGSTSAPNIKTGTLTSPLGTINVGYSSPDITLDVTGGTIVNSITAGPGITITGTAAVPIINSVIFTNQAGSTTVTSNSGSYATAAITLTLPATPAQGDELIFVAITAGALVLDAPSTHLIRIGNQVTSAGGTMTSTAIGDSVTLRYRTTDTTWYAVSSIGSWTPA